jgi:hypothetical protein
MKSASRFLGGLTASLTLLACATAHAQAVRKCEVAGRTVFQSSPCAVEAKVASAAPQQAATAQPAVAPKKKTLADLLRERDGADRNRSQVREFQGDGANVLRSRMGAV